jgi:hypothetical protein
MPAGFSVLAVAQHAQVLDRWSWIDDTWRIVGDPFRANLCSVRHLLVATLVGVVACRSSTSEPKAAEPECRSSVEKGARTGVAGAKTGVTTGVEGVKTFGRSVGGLFEDGSDGAKREWKKGAQETKKTAREGSSEVHEEASAPKCR